MLKFATIALAGTALVAAALLSPADPAAAQAGAPVKLEGIAWRTDLEAARREAKATGKPLLAAFR